MVGTAMRLSFGPSLVSPTAGRIYSVPTRLTNATVGLLPFLRFGQFELVKSDGHFNRYVVH